MCVLYICVVWVWGCGVGGVLLLGRGVLGDVVDDTYDTLLDIGVWCWVCGYWDI